MTTVNHGLTGLPSVFTTRMSNSVWSACHIALGRSAVKLQQGGLTSPSR
jgi:hypothetical protein